MIEGHTRPVKSFEVLSFLLQDLQAILLDSLIIYQLGLEQAGCQDVVTVDLNGFNRLALLL